MGQPARPTPRRGQVRRLRRCSRLRPKHRRSAPADQPPHPHGVLRKCSFQSNTIRTNIEKFKSRISRFSTRARPFNLGCCILPSKVASDTSFLSHLWTDLA